MCLDIPRGAHILAFLNIIFLKLFHRGKSEVNLKQLCSSPPHKDSPQPLKWAATLKQPEKQRKWSRWLSVIWWSFGCFSLLKMYIKIDGSLYVSFLIRDFKDLISDIGISIVHLSKSCFHLYLLLYILFDKPGKWQTSVLKKLEV